MSNQGVLAKIATPYAEALLEAARYNDSLESINQDLCFIRDLLSESIQLQLFLDNPLVASVAKKSVLSNLLADQVSHTVLKFLLILVDRRRIGLLITIIQKYLELVYKLDSITIAQVRTSIALTEEQQMSLITKIKSITKSKEVKLVFTIDTSLIGGFIIQIGSKVIDTSLSGKLKSMSSYLQRSTI